MKLQSSECLLHYAKKYKFKYSFPRNMQKKNEHNKVMYYLQNLQKNSDSCRTCITPSEGPVCIQPEDAHLPQGKLQHVKDT